MTNYGYVSYFKLHSRDSWKFIFGHESFLSLNQTQCNGLVSSQACYFKVMRQDVLKLRGRGRVGHVTLVNKNFGRRFQPSCIIVINRFYLKHDNSHENCLFSILLAVLS